MKRILPITLLALALFVAWRFRPSNEEAPADRETAARNASAGSKGFAGPANRRSSALDRSPLADALNSPATDIRTDLRIVTDIIETFRSNFLQTGNPVGTNAEITAALTGKNPLRLSLIPPDHPAINQNGELCDRWGTPFFFHAESATKMEIRSAGPDQKMWNEDDVVLSP